MVLVLMVGMLLLMLEFLLSLSGQTWDLLVDTAHPYDFDCGYGWIWNDSAYENRQPLNHLAPGWGGSSGGWFNYS